MSVSFLGRIAGIYLRPLAPALVSVLFAAGCASTPPPSVPTEEIDRYSDGEAYYAGLYNTFIYRATILNAPVRAVLLSKLNDFYQWDREKFSSEREKSEREFSQETVVFLSFYTPERRNDNLADDKAIWRVYLEVGGTRYQGKIKKVRTSFAELQALYPYHTRWNTPYEVRFQLPTSAVETQVSKLTVTGPLGNKVVNFPSVR